MQRRCLVWLLLIALIAAPVYSSSATMLHPNFPVIEGQYQMTKEWSIQVPEKFNRRFEDGSLVIWRPGFTMWIGVWGNDKKQTKKERLAELKQRISKGAFELEESQDTNALRFSYRLKEDAHDKRVPALFGFAFGENGHVQIAFYFDREEDVKQAKTILKSLHEKNAS